MPPQYAKAYRKWQKNDAADAATIREAATQPSTRFIPIKTDEQQTALTIHRTRNLQLRQRTMLINALCGDLAEFGLVAPPRNMSAQLLQGGGHPHRHEPHVVHHRSQSADLRGDWTANGLAVVRGAFRRSLRWRAVMVCW